MHFNHQKPKFLISTNDYNIYVVVKQPIIVLYLLINYVIWLQETNLWRFNTPFRYCSVKPCISLIVYEFPLPTFNYSTLSFWQ